jgi:hypothetical protein
VRPDDPRKEPRELGSQGAKWSVLLDQDHALSEGTVGAWTMAADAGFVVSVRGYRFVALSDFTPLPDDDDGHWPLALREQHARCGSTLVGWYRSDDFAEFGCFVGERTGAAGSLGLLATHAQLRRSGFLARQGSDVDWRSRGVVPPPREQGHCASCYAIAATDMLTARHRIAQGDTQAERFSAALPVACGEYTQGCGAGYPFLAAVWSEDVGLLPESAAPYGVRDCAQVHAAKSSWRASQARYVSADDLVQELTTNGPIAVSFVAPASLRQYSGGLYEPGGDEEVDGLPVSHSALLTGYSESGDYWVVQNSWGEKWGEGGSFRLSIATARRLQLESLPVVADVVEDEHPEVLAGVLSRGGALLQDPTPENTCSDGSVIVHADGTRRSLRFAGSVGTETAVDCEEDCTLKSGPCDGQQCPCTVTSLPYAGLNAIVDKASLVCEASGSLSLLVVGLGGGAVPTTVRQKCPASTVESVELSRPVVEAASQFFGFAPDANNSVEVGDGGAALARRAADGAGPRYDVVVVDCFGDADSVPEGCRNPAFIQAAFALLRPDGLLVQNVWARSGADKAGVLPQQYADMQQLYADTFGKAQVRTEAVVDEQESQELLLTGIKGSRWLALFPE